MRAVDIKGGKGGIDALFINDQTPKPSPGPHEALVKIKAFGLNRMDVSQREGKYPVPKGASKVLGVEFSGLIEAFGAQGHEDFKVGDEVFGLTYGGAYAEYVAVSTRMLIHRPKELSWEMAAGIPEVWMTATQALFLVGGFTKGQSVMWHAGASSVSIAGIQLSKAEGASAIYVTAGSKKKIDFCVSELGATAGFNYHEDDFSEAIKKATDGKGADLIIDFIGQNYFQKNLNSAALDGTVVMLGLMSGLKTTEGVDLAPILMRRITVRGSTLRARTPEYQGKLRDTVVEHALPKLLDGTFSHFIEKVFPMEDIKEAHKLMESNTTQGKIICTVG